MITSKPALIATMQANPTYRLYGHSGARPASHWKYTLRDEAAKKDIDTVSAVVVNKMHEADALHTVRSSWMSYAVYSLAGRLRNPTATA